MDLKIENISKKNGWCYIKAQIYNNEKERKKYTLNSRDGHLNPEGYKLLSEKIYLGLKDCGLI